VAGRRLVALGYIGRRDVPLGNVGRRLVIATGVASGPMFTWPASRQDHRNHGGEYNRDDA
jgi:hypothetical protein